MVEYRRGSAARGVRGEERQEVLHVDLTIKVEVAAKVRGGIRGQEREEILDVHLPVAVEVRGADAHKLVRVVEVDPADVLAPGVAAEAVGGGVVAGPIDAQGGGRVEVDPADVLAPGESGQVAVGEDVHAGVGAGGVRVA